MITAPDAAGAMLEILRIGPTPDAHTFHVVHPRGVSFNALVGLVASWLKVPLCLFPEWFCEALRGTQGPIWFNKTPSGQSRAAHVQTIFGSAPVGPRMGDLSVLSGQILRARYACQKCWQKVPTPPSHLEKSVCGSGWVLGPRAASSLKKRGGRSPSLS